MNSINTTDYLQGHIAMIDLASPEVNRGSFCYLSYLLYSAFTSPNLPQIKSVKLWEEFRVGDLDEIMYELKEADTILVGLWSYPQIDAALLLNRFLKGRCHFYGYYPLIEKLGLNVMQYTEEHLLEGLRTYPTKVCSNVFQYDLLSDCDKHIKDGAKRTASGISDKMVPMFTSYGCPLGCTFCSATVNCNKKRTVLDVCDVINNLLRFSQAGRYAVHFTDEDFFFNPDRATEILLAAHRISSKFEFIALGGMNTVNQFCDFVSEKLLPEDQDKVWQVLRLIEIGLETVDPGLAKAMGKGGRSGPLRATLVQKKCRCPVLWLTVTFFPGETINTLNATGQFLREHGLAPNRMEERIVTNGTEGGLGQFFQYYEGAGLSMREFENSGVVLSQRPMRLIPSFIPNSFLTSRFTVNWQNVNWRYDELHYWFGVYGIDAPPSRVRDMLNETDNIDRSEQVKDVIDCSTLLSYTNDCVAIAIMARLSILEGV